MTLYEILAALFILAANGDLSDYECDKRPIPGTNAFQCVSATSRAGDDRSGDMPLSAGPGKADERRTAQPAPGAGQDSPGDDNGKPDDQPRPDAPGGPGGKPDKPSKDKSNASGNNGKGGNDGKAGKDRDTSKNPRG